MDLKIVLIRSHIAFWFGEAYLTHFWYPMVSSCLYLAKKIFGNISFLLVIMFRIVVVNYGLNVEVETCSCNQFSVQFGSLV